MVWGYLLIRLGGRKGRRKDGQGTDAAMPGGDGGCLRKRRGHVQKHEWRPRHHDAPGRKGAHALGLPSRP